MRSCQPSEASALANPARQALLPTPPLVTQRGKAPANPAGHAPCQPIRVSPSAARLPPTPPLVAQRGRVHANPSASRLVRQGSVPTYSRLVDLSPPACLSSA